VRPIGIRWFKNKAHGPFERIVARFRLGFLGTVGLFAACFGAIQGLFYLCGGVLGLPGFYRSGIEGGGLVAWAWVFSLVVPVLFCAVFLVTQDRRNRERLTRTWDSWRWFDQGVDLLGTEQEFSSEQEDCFARSAALDSEDPYARNNLGAVLWHQGRFEEAVSACREAIRRNPDYYQAYANLGAAWARLGETRRAVGLYRKALKLNPRDPATQLNLGLALARLGSNVQAASHLREFLRLSPEHPRRQEVAALLSRLG
jgi:tetratricopeptide (TPR) repeat protein